MSNYSILTHPEHPFFHQLSTDEHVLHYYYDHGKFIEQVSQSKEVDVLIDLTLVSTAEKKSLYTRLKHNAPFDLKIISDLSCSWGDLLMEKFPFVAAATSLGFYSPTQTYEVVLRNEKVRDALEAFFEKYDLQIKEVYRAGMGFTYPRTISQIINEAHFALDEGLCREEDMDQAMKKGVNYPLGPLEWGEKIGLRAICQLLDELYEITHDPRYAACPELRLRAKAEKN